MMNENIYEVTYRLDFGEWQEDTKGILIDKKHVLYWFENHVALAVNVNKEGRYYWSQNAGIYLGEAKDSSIEFLRKMEMKLKTTSLFNFFTTDKDVTYLDHEFNLTEE
ncbi:hypothetical protein [Bacillus sp. USDA818B3_A]|uniref:hypothetical protein n=1 Tax=Bacillus sp. USDA818B3_A TaxID=2698834 RepID=UPI00136FA9B3|nr:hypothetical protein [Bacillus sp. USDA818B3_A]